MSLPRKVMAVPLFSDHIRGAGDQMGIDSSLMEKISSGAGDFVSLLRVYRILPGQVTVGRTYRGVPPAEWGLAHCQYVHRPTGGGAVLHGQDICFSLLLSVRPQLSLVSLYSFLHLFFGKFVEELGIEPSLGGKSGVPYDGRGTCFLEPVCGDLMADSKKILGGAMKLGRQGFLYQGSLLIEGYSPEILQRQFASWYSGVNRFFVCDGQLRVDA